MSAKSPACETGGNTHGAGIEKQRQGQSVNSLGIASRWAGSVMMTAPRRNGCRLPLIDSANPFD